MDRRPRLAVVRDGTLASGTVSPCSGGCRPAAAWASGGEHPGAGAVLDDQAVAHPDDPLGVLGDVVFVGDHDDGLAGVVEPAEHLHDLVAGRGVEVAGRLVGQDDVGVVDQRPGDRHALLLAAGELGRAGGRGGRPGRPAGPARTVRSWASSVISPLPW